MTENDAESAGLPDAVKATLFTTGVVSGLKHAIHGHEEANNDVQVLKKDAQAMAEALQQMLDGGGLDDAAAQKLSAVLSRLKTALQGKHLSREALATVLSEAGSVMGNTEGSNKAASAVTIEQLWQQIDGYNKAIDDDFEKMRNAGILFDETLWNKHLQFSEHLKTHPRDIDKQKELDATDDALLLQAEPQLSKCPGAKESFDDAKQKSKDRHQTVDEDLAGLEKKNATLNTNVDLDWGAAPKSSPSTLKDVTMNDVEAQTFTASADKNSSKTFVRKQTNVCFRTKLHHMPVVNQRRNAASPLIGAAFRDRQSSIFLCWVVTLFKGKRWFACEHVI